MISEKIIEYFLAMQEKIFFLDWLYKYMENHQLSVL